MAPERESHISPFPDEGCSSSEKESLCLRSHGKWQKGIFRQAEVAVSPPFSLPRPPCALEVAWDSTRLSQWEGGLALLFLGWVYLNTLSVLELQFPPRAFNLGAGVPALPHSGLLCCLFNPHLRTGLFPQAPALSGDTALPSRDCWCIKEPDLTSDNCDKALRAQTA